MKNFSTHLSELFQHAATSAFGITDAVDIAQSTFSDYQCNSALKLGKSLQKNPREVASLLITHLQDPDRLIAKTEIAGPGFINIFLNTDKLSQRLNQTLTDPMLGVQKPPTLQRIVCDFSSPNIAKAMHVGHLRSTIIGDSLARLFEFLGHTVLRLNHVGNWGTQFGMLITYIKETHVDPKAASVEDLMQWYKAAKKRFDDDPSFKTRSQEEVVALQAGHTESLAVWETICSISRKSYQEIYDLLDVTIEERGESFYNPYLPTVIEEFRKQNLLQIDDGATCVFLDGFTIPLIVQKRDGGFNYATTDLAGFTYRVQHDHADRIVIVTDSGQSMHFAMVHAAALKAHLISPAIRFDHVPFGLVLSPEGKKFKTREGETERLIDLLHEAITEARKLVDNDADAKVLGIGAVKYADLSCNRIKDYTFSYERMLKFEGNTVVFILYAFVRIQSLLRKFGSDNAPIAIEHPSEIALGLHLARFGEALHAMDEELLPHKLTDYLYTLAEKFHLFFRDCHIEGSSQKQSRLSLCILTARVIEKGLFLLGIKTLEKL